MLSKKHTSYVKILHITKISMEYYPPILIATIIFLFIFFFSFLFRKYSSYKNGGSSCLPVDLPLFGMIPSVLLNIHRIFEYQTEGLQETQGNFLVKGPWFSKLELFITADPTNVHYIMSKQHERFNRGPNFNEIFDVLGDGLISSDFDKWKYQRKIAMATFISTRFRLFLKETLVRKLKKGLIPLLDHSHKEGVVIDMQDIFHSLAADVTFMLLIGHDTNYLSFDSSSYTIEKVSSHETEDAIMARHVLPPWVWKLQKWLGIGNEGKLSEYAKFLDGLAHRIITNKRDESMKTKKESQDQSKAIDMINLYMEENYGAAPDLGFKSTDVFLRDTFVTFLLAGQDTVSTSLAWFFWFLIRHPHVQVKIKEELASHNLDEGYDVSQISNANNLVYLHASILEALRLYPAVPMAYRSPIQEEKLPSGHVVKPWTKILLSPYTMARMKCVWGEDCEEFKPERWITEEGMIKHEPSHKFFSFSTGPRVCIGKEIALVQMKMVAREVLRHDYRFEVVKGHRVEPASLVVLRMKYGLKVKVMKKVGL